MESCLVPRCRFLALVLHQSAVVQKKAVSLEVDNQVEEAENNLGGVVGPKKDRQKAFLGGDIVALEALVVLPYDALDLAWGMVSSC